MFLCVFCGKMKDGADCFKCLKKDFCGKCIRCGHKKFRGECLHCASKKCHEYCFSSVRNDLSFEEKRKWCPLCYDKLYHKCFPTSLSDDIILVEGIDENERLHKRRIRIHSLKSYVFSNMFKRCLNKVLNRDGIIVRKPYLIINGKGYNYKVMNRNFDTIEYLSKDLFDEIQSYYGDTICNNIKSKLIDCVVGSYLDSFEAFYIEHLIKYKSHTENGRILKEIWETERFCNF